MPLISRFPSGKAVRLGFFVLLILWALLAGKDVSWDVVNHHLYLPFSWLTGRFRTDLFGAGGQSYQNPLGYFPIYALVRIGLPAWIIGVILSATHAAIVWPLDRIARLFWPGDQAEDFWFRVLALAFCCVAPIFLIHDGTTSTDPITALMVVWAIALSLGPADADAAKPASRRSAAVAGVLLGVAAAIKLSNAFFALALCVLWLLKWALRQVDLPRALAFGTGLAVAFTAAAGPWMWWLWQDFHNPIYPLYNNLFHSPEAPQQPLVFLRFVPSTPWGMISRVWEMAQFSSFVAFEEFLPDIRPLLAAIAGLAALAVLGMRGGWRRLGARTTWRQPGVQLALLMVLMYLLWIRSSGNARYALPLFVLIGIGLVRATQRVMPFPAAKVVLLTALLIQGGNYLLLGAHRFAGVSWDAGPYLDYRVSKRLQEQPFLHLTIGTQTNADVALFLAPGGALANPIGSFPLPTDGPLGARLEALMAQWHGRTRLLFAAPMAVKPAEIDMARRQIRALLYRLGVDADWTDCETIAPLANREEWRPWMGPFRVDHGHDRPLLSCAVIYRTDKDPQADAELVAANKVFAILEAACPRVFSPPPFASEHGMGVWQRNYVNTEARLTVSVTEGVNFSHFRMLKGTFFGSIDDVLNHNNPIQCPVIQYQTPS